MLYGCNVTERAHRTKSLSNFKAYEEEHRKLLDGFKVSKRKFAAVAIAKINKFMLFMSCQCIGVIRTFPCPHCTFHSDNNECAVDKYIYHLT
jgi:hypothetical protein